MNDRVIWITGASSGIGEALALDLAARGARLIVSARRVDKLESLRERCADPTRVELLPLDVAETEHAGEHAEDARRAFGRVDVLVHNAGISQRSLVAETALEVDRRIMEVNYFGVVALTKAIYPSMIAQRRGHFVVVSSVTGYVGTPYRSAYAASKHALHGFFESLRTEGREQGIDVTMVCPGFVRTDITLSALSGDGSAHGKHERTNRGGIPPEACAASIRRAIEKPRAEVYVGGKEIAAIYLRRYAPALLREVLKRVPTT